MPDNTMTLPDVNPHNHENVASYFTDRQPAAMWHPFPSRPHTEQGVLPTDRDAGNEAR